MTPARTTTPIRSVSVVALILDRNRLMKGTTETPAAAYGALPQVGGSVDWSGGCLPVLALGRAYGVPAAVRDAPVKVAP